MAGIDGAGSRWPLSEPPRRKERLESFIGHYANEVGVVPERIQRLLAFELLTCALSPRPGDDDPLLVIKGGYHMEIRLNLQGRATQDIDAMLRAEADHDGIRDVVTDALGASLCDGHVHFEVSDTRPIGTTGALRMKIKVFWGPKVLSHLTLEVSPLKGDATLDWEDLPTLDIARNFGIEVAPSTPCLPIRFQIAQKVHAVTDPRESNDRFRDLIDLLLLDDIGGISDELTRAACVQVFSYRRDHEQSPNEWPPMVSVRPAWAAGFKALADEMAFPIRDVDDAVARVQSMIDRIAAAV